MADDQLTDQTKAEQDYGRKMAAQNAAAFARALKAREAENPPEPDHEAQAAVDEALQQAEPRKPQKEKKHE